MTTIASPFTFALDAALEADRPPEAGGGRRDDVRLLVTDTRTGESRDERFDRLPSLLRPGDLLVVNDSATLPAAVWLDRLVLHFSTPHRDGRWLVELRRRVGDSHVRYDGGRANEWLPLPGGATLKLVERHSARLWVAELDVSVSIYLNEYGRPIRYSYVNTDRPLADYQTIFAAEPGSAEMPSAGRPFTKDTLNGLRRNGIDIATITLHTGVASPEADEPPYPERFTVDRRAAQAVNAVRADGGRVIAVGTTVVRAVESATDSDGVVSPRSGVTEHLITPDTGVRAVDGILTGLHEPRSTHLSMLSAICPVPALAEAYRRAVAGRYLWHEFGDVHLIC
ncbi:S-adenosylmethionine:tRNA ribosyltransferase-isomerase [Stackebrandtia soli]|uniref:S-adenosylmethionine:tRNA ribosyltransferase-isomerase n=1 Tax=Stackebrandtia soli TaxID=1892856 RepID=UPI0039EAC7DB